MCWSGKHSVVITNNQFFTGSKVLYKAKNQTISKVDIPLYIRMTWVSDERVQGVESDELSEIKFCITKSESNCSCESWICFPSWLASWTPKLVRNEPQIFGPIQLFQTCFDQRKYFRQSYFIHEIRRLSSPGRREHSRWPWNLTSLLAYSVPEHMLHWDGGSAPLQLLYPVGRVECSTKANSILIVRLIVSDCSCSVVQVVSYQCWKTVLRALVNLIFTSSDAALWTILKFNQLSRVSVKKYEDANSILTRQSCW